MGRTVSLSLIAAFLLGSAALAADQPGPDWISKDELIRRMGADGYSSIVVGVDDGHWEGEAVKDGRIVEFHADGRTGRITKSEPKKE